MCEAGQKGLAFRRGGGSYLGVRGGTVTDKDTWNRSMASPRSPGRMVGFPNLPVAARQWMERARGCDTTAPKTWMGCASHTPDGGFLPRLRAGRPKDCDTVETPVLTRETNVGSHPEPWKWIPPATAQHGQDTAGGTDWITRHNCIEVHCRGKSG